MFSGFTKGLMKKILPIAEEEKALRGELLNLTQLGQQAESFAKSHLLLKGSGSTCLLSRLDENERILRDYNRVTRSFHINRRITPATEWLLDNFYLIEEQIQMVRLHFPKGYSRELPCGESSVPRVYEMILDIISHVDAQIDAQSLQIYISTYQSVTPLKLGELWAIPIMLRMGLIENLQRITTRLASARKSRDLAAHWIRRFHEIQEKNPSDFVIVMAEMTQSNLVYTSSFVAEFCQSLISTSATMHWTRNWFEQLLTEKGLSIDLLTQEENQLQAAEQVSVSHSITSLRFLSAINWKDFVESMSEVHQILQKDPQEIYSKMDFFTRDAYRHSVEAIASKGPSSEIKVAQEAIELAEKNKIEKGVDDRASHVGYYLIRQGRSSLEKKCEASIAWGVWSERLFRQFSKSYYLGGIVVITGGISWGFMTLIAAKGVEFPVWGELLFSFSLLLCASQSAVALMNGITTAIVHPQLLPRLDFSKEIPVSATTMAVIPTLLASPKGIEKLLESIEIHYLGNQDPHLSFALLTDFSDASTETMPTDQIFLDQARSGIEGLNHKYPADRSPHFLMFHRPRRWNEREKCWMGYERKRGKLAEFNALLIRGNSDRFSMIVGDFKLLPTVRYVITLDTDTQMPREVAQKMIGTAAHPLNHPIIDSKTSQVVDGYVILQPRAMGSLLSSTRSWFGRIYAGDIGIDPYTCASSDVYQDLFGECSFIGKGIYDLQAFEVTTAGRFPENKILSHDLIESCYARCGLMSDVILYEDHPTSLITEMRRQHRWLRGDWQISRWLRSTVPQAEIKGGDKCVLAQNPLSILSQWKILDNLRRSLIAPILFALLLGSWFFLPTIHQEVGLLLLITMATGSIFSLFLTCIKKSKDLSFSIHGKECGNESLKQSAQFFLQIIFLPNMAILHLDAILRASYRLLVSKRRLLEWQTAGEVERSNENGLMESFRSLSFSPILVLGIVLLVFNGEISLDFPQAVLIGLWLIAPWIAWSIGQPFVNSTLQLNRDQNLFLRRIARKTWRFFEVFVDENENYLPPDNFQELPSPTIASRTSPTNIGLSLLSNLSAFDFGYLNLHRLIQRTENTFNTLNQLDRFQGHFYNWYDTRSLKPLVPRYISSVDSGNLAGHLLVLESGFIQMIEAPIYSTRLFNGLYDTACLLKESLVKSSDLDEVLKLLVAPPNSFIDGSIILERLKEPIFRLTQSKDSLENSDLNYWSQALDQQIRDASEDLFYLAPWIRDKKVKFQGEFTPLMSDCQRLLDHLSIAPTLRNLAELSHTVLPLLEEILSIPSASPSVEKESLSVSYELLLAIRLSSERATERILRLEALAQQSHEFACMDFNFLFDLERNLFVIGYNVDECKRDRGYYDLLASEARLCSYVGIALGQIHQDHWFSLGRLLLSSERGTILASWSGSLFEYLMPLLVMPNYPMTLLDQTYFESIKAQISYGELKEIPWGVSESGYNRTDSHFNYQYKAFGVPGLGLKRGLGEDLVIAPYAAVMGLMIAPQKACDNLKRISKEGFEGVYGFYEAIDYTPSRLPPGQSNAPLRSFMAHHQGMSFLSINFALHQQPMQRRFLRNPWLKSTVLLLQERIPKTNSSLLPDEVDDVKSHKRQKNTEGTVRVFNSPSLSNPEIHLLTNGRYQVMVTSAGSGYSRWHNLALTRWREDATQDCWGSFFYLREPLNGNLWSTTHQPTTAKHTLYEAIFTQGRAEFRQRYEEIESHTELCISPEDDVELRRITLVNHSSEIREIEVTSFAEMVLAPHAADEAHPAFSNLFVQTEFLSESSALLCTRRPRSEKESVPWLFHLWIPESGEIGSLSYDTDRSQFIGRGRTLQNPIAMQGALKNSVGSVLDPIIALRRTICLQPHQTIRLHSVMGATDRRELALALIEKYHNPRMMDRALELAWTHSQVLLHHLNISEKEAQQYMQLAGSLIYPNPSKRAPATVLLANRRTQSALWGYGISGDLPIVLVRIRDQEKMNLVQQLIHAHAYWRSKGIVSDLVILNEDDSHYHQQMQERVLHIIASGSESAFIDKPGGIFVRKIDQLPIEDRTLFQAVAHLLFECENGTLEEQLQQITPRLPSPPLLVVTKPPLYPPHQTAFRELVFHNGIGGFTKDGREYVMRFEDQMSSPAPWVNVIANSDFGTVISEGGSAYTWSENCHEFRLTPWNNDPVTDPSGEAFYIRDEQTGLFWSPTPGPARGINPYVVRHGFGYSVFEHEEQGIISELWVYVAVDAPIKLVSIKLRNVSGRARSISVTGYWEWVLGDLRSRSQRSIQTQIDPKSGALLIRNPLHREFSERIVFLDVHDSGRGVTGDRKEFIGRNGSLRSPAAMKRVRLSGKVGAGFDPCGAIQVFHELPSEGSKEISFRIGVGKNSGEVQGLIQRFRRPEALQKTLQEVHEHWNKTVGSVQIESPDPAVNLMANGWLLYQTLSCRMWARTGFYQSGGAFGFRDQLQDSMALIHSKPGLVREHLLRAAAQQFREGDVQHWWHPPSGRGVRTHFSDDLLWLPFVLCHYVTTIGDTGVLDEPVSFIESRLLRKEEESNFDLPIRSSENASLYHHATRAIERGFQYGEHGLPLIGCGDWNDGMNLVGKEGRGESVWLAFFFYDLLIKFSTLAQNHHDPDFSARCLQEAESLQLNIEKYAWDGQWYKRAFFDDGSPLGSHTNIECQIDSLPQSWSVLSRAGNLDRTHQAMSAVLQRLVRRDARLVQLFDPPFESSESSNLNPGYIKGYIPGVRENGGQYTHGAIWSAMAFAELGEIEKAWELFEMLNPIHHGDTPERISTYKVEPYVVAADVYAVAPHIGRGGWTWYTGSAGWMYRFLMETLLGLHLEGEYLRLQPRIPMKWNDLKIRYRYRQTDYQISISISEFPEMILDGKILADHRIPLIDDQQCHQVQLKIKKTPLINPKPL